MNKKNLILSIFIFLVSFQASNLFSFSRVKEVISGNKLLTVTTLASLGYLSYKILNYFRSQEDKQQKSKCSTDVKIVADYLLAVMGFKNLYPLPSTNAEEFNHVQKDDKTFVYEPYFYEEFIKGASFHDRTKDQCVNKRILTEKVLISNERKKINEQIEKDNKQNKIKIHNSEQLPKQPQIQKEKSEAEEEKFTRFQINSFIRNVQTLEQIFLSNNFKELSEFFKISLKHYDQSGPMIFQQLFIENFKELKERLKIYKKGINQIVDKEERELNKKKIFDLNNVINAIYMAGPWFQGYLVINEIFSNSKDWFKQSWQSHWQNMMYVIWAFYEMAINEGKQFIEGTFNIESSKLLHFFSKYGYAYDRSGKYKCSHYHEIEAERFGANIPETERKINSFPNNKVHILFGDISQAKYMPFKVDEQLKTLISSSINLTPAISHVIAQYAATNYNEFFFLKPETHPTENPEPGATWTGAISDFLNHADEWRQAQYRKYTGGNDESYMKKERIPDMVLEQWSKLYKSYNQNKLSAENKKILNQYNIDIKIYGIKAIVKFLSELSFKLDNNEEYSQQFLQHRNVLEELISKFDELEVRKGSEVILTKAKINKYLKTVSELNIQINNEKDLNYFFKN